MSEPFSLEGHIARQREEVEGALGRALTRAPLPDALADAVRHGVLSGGKRLRPVLCATAYEACGGTPVPASYDLAASLELIHAYSLMHDDLPAMDDAALRRGAPTTHTVHGETTTVLAGAALIPLAARTALVAARELGCDTERQAQLVTTLLDGAGAAGMVGGQWLDLLGEDRALAGAELDDLHRRKTGALLRASVTLGGLGAGASSEVVDGLDAYGRAIGLAFQIADDVLDVTQTAETLGKNPSDTELEKSTYVTLYGVEEARRRAAEEVGRAKVALQEVGLASPALDHLADYVVARRK